MLVRYYRRRVQEEVVFEALGTNDEPLGTVTRNRYGALVLNSPQVMFLDWDVNALARLRAQKVGFLVRLRRAYLGYSNRELAQATQDGKPALERRIREQATALGLSLRLYETHQGYRALVTRATFAPADEGTQALFQTLEVDALYARLCRLQECFRARLTPKPWRIDVPHPPGKHPRSGPGIPVFETWLERYERASDAFASARYVTTIGPEPRDPVILETARFHDRVTQASKNLPLA